MIDFWKGFALFVALVGPWAVEAKEGPSDQQHHGHLRLKRELKEETCKICSAGSCGTQTRKRGDLRGNGETYNRTSFAYSTGPWEGTQVQIDVKEEKYSSECFASIDGQDCECTAIDWEYTYRKCIFHPWIIKPLEIRCGKEGKEGYYHACARTPNEQPGSLEFLDQYKYTAQGCDSEHGYTSDLAKDRADAMHLCNQALTDPDGCQCKFVEDTNVLLAQARAVMTCTRPQCTTCNWDDSVCANRAVGKSFSPTGEVSEFTELSLLDGSGTVFTHELTGSMRCFFSINGKKCANCYRDFYKGVSEYSVGCENLGGGSFFFNGYTEAIGESDATGLVKRNIAGSTECVDVNRDAADACAEAAASEKFANKGCQCLPKMGDNSVYTLTCRRPDCPICSNDKTTCGYPTITQEFYGYSRSRPIAASFQYSHGKQDSFEFEIDEISRECVVRINGRECKACKTTVVGPPNYYTFGCDYIDPFFDQRAEIDCSNIAGGGVYDGCTLRLPNVTGTLSILSPEKYQHDVCGIPAQLAQDNYHGDTLRAGDAPLRPGGYLRAGEFRLGLGRNDAQLRLQRLSASENDSWDTIWSADYNTGGSKDAKLVLQGDGNAVVYVNRSPVWSSGTVAQDSNPGYFLTLFNNGAWYILQGTHTVIKRFGSEQGATGYTCTRRLPNDKVLAGNDYICDGDVTFGMEAGTLVARQYSPNEKFWETAFRARISIGPNDYSSNSAILQGDGNLVIVTGSNKKPLWSSRTSGNPGTTLGIGSSFMPVLFKSNGEEIPIVNANLACKGTKLRPSEFLYSGEVLCRDDFMFGMDQWGDLGAWSLRERPDKIWSAGTISGYSNFAVMQDDGNFVVYSFLGEPLWSSRTSQKRNAYLQIGSGNLVAVLSADIGEKLWTIPEGEKLQVPDCSNARTLFRGDRICYHSARFGLDYNGVVTTSQIRQGRWRNNHLDMNGRVADRLELQGDGNVVAYEKHGDRLEAIWSTRTSGYPAENIRLVCDPNCRLSFSKGRTVATVGISSNLDIPEFHCTDKATVLYGDTLYGGEMACLEAQGHKFGLDKQGGIWSWKRGQRDTKRIGPPDHKLGMSSYGNRLVLQGDGNLVLYNYKNEALWASATRGGSSAFVEINNKGKVQITNVENGPKKLSM